MSAEQATPEAAASTPIATPDPGQAPALPTVSLDDKYRLESGTAFMTGMQALVRLPLVQQRRDARAGLHTAGYISGYRGSPVGTYDLALWAAKPWLEEHHIHFQPGVNEDLAATAVWGSQQVNMLGGARYDGVFGIWYGKAPGVDRTLDAFRHANIAGTSPHGGVLAIAGDDPNAVSSTVTSSSEPDFVSVGIPVIYPATLQEYLDFGVQGIAMSRFTGCWVGFKAVTDIAESSACVDLDIDRVRINTPEYSFPEGGVHIRWPDERLPAEKRLVTVKLPAVQAFARANPFDRNEWDMRGDTLGDTRGDTHTAAGQSGGIGLIAAGKSWLDLRQALADLGIDAALAARLGIRLRKLGLVWPIEEAGMREFCAGLDTVLVIEEKRGFIEDQVAVLLHRAGVATRVLGKLDAAGNALLPAHGELGPALIAEALAKVVPAVADLPAAQARAAILAAQRSALAAVAADPVAARIPYFCSGCPHNTSTKVPEGSLALAGIGCHWLSLYMGRDTATFTHMGGEGATWLGMMPFSERKHVFVNLGDGTYHHSGIMAIRAAVYAKANVTYKLLFNDAVAMTGGQQVSDSYTPQQIVAQIMAEGVQRAVVVSDDVDKYRALPGPNGGFPVGVPLVGREELERVHRELREVEGVTLLLYDQTCAAEKRRRRKRGRMADPDTRVFINAAVCEGCGDCSVASNCISVEPYETTLGRKRRINQSACNKDTSCVNGFCPSFVTLKGASPRKLQAAALPGASNNASTNASTDIEALVHALPAPTLPALDHAYEIVITGIGGTGVITIGALLGMAARIAGLGVTCLDQTGISQKNGAVLSHVRLARRQEDLYSVRVAPAKADLVLGCDLMVAAGPAALATMARGRTRVLANSHLAPDARFVMDPVRADFGEEGLRAAITGVVGGAALTEINATRLAERLFGDSIAANVFMLGHAWQLGLLPVPLAALLRAIELNGTAVQLNRAALSWGRYAAGAPDAVARMLAPAQPVVIPLARRKETLEAVRADRRARLVAYQDDAYARRYDELVERAARAEAAVAGQASQAKERTPFALAVARQAYRLMAYKDEYEVARLYTDGSFAKELGEAFEGDVRLAVHLAPPLLARRDAVTGHLVKRAWGPWMFTAFKLLARLKGLRGTAFDLFGKTAERRMERQLIVDYFELIDELCQGLAADNLKQAIELAGLPEDIRGFGHVKEKRVAEVRARWQALLQAWRSGPAHAEEPRIVEVARA